MSCQARQYSDQKVCHRCGTVWDMNDPDPPPCKIDKQLVSEKYIEPLKRKLRE